jgi:hypothetical protein
MSLIRDDSRPCPVNTNQFEWGNVCPRDPNGLGVHACTLPASHLSANGADEAEWCLCACGTRRPADRPAVKRG